MLNFHFSLPLTDCCQRALLLWNKSEVLERLEGLPSKGGEKKKETTFVFGGGLCAFYIHQTGIWGDYFMACI